MPLGVAPAATVPELEQWLAHIVLARFKDGDGEMVIYDALWDQKFSKALLTAVERRRRIKGLRGELIATPTQAFKTIMAESPAGLDPSVMGAEQSNTSVAYGTRAILK